MELSANVRHIPGRRQLTIRKLCWMLCSFRIPRLSTENKGLLVQYRTVRLAFAIITKPASRSSSTAVASLVARCPFRAKEPQVVSIPRDGVKNIS